MPRHTNAGRKHRPSGPAIKTPARSAAALRRARRPVGIARPAPRPLRPAPLPTTTTGAPAATAHRSASRPIDRWRVQATAGSAPSASRSAARRSTRASSGGADGAVADAAVDTAIPAAGTPPARRDSTRRPTDQGLAPDDATTRGVRRRHPGTGPHARRPASLSSAAARSIAPVGSSRRRPLGDVIRPQQPTADQRQPDDQQHTAQIARQAGTPPGRAPMSSPINADSSGSPARMAAVVRAPVIPDRTCPENRCRSAMSRCAVCIRVEIARP